MQNNVNKVTIKKGKLIAPNYPEIRFIEGDGFDSSMATIYIARFIYNDQTLANEII